MIIMAFNPKTDVWVISDTHFLHSNSITKWSDGRKIFEDVHHMNEVIIQNWNSVVKPGDIVYHLGDVFIGDRDEFKKLWPRLNGRKRLVVGNHDDIKFLSSGSFFQKVLQSKTIPEYGIIMTHQPIRMGDVNDYHKYGFNVHGHVHNYSVPDKRYYNVSVEVINYTPVNLDTIIKHFKSI